jgi:hypothetical protein
MFLQPLPEDRPVDVEKKKPQHERLRPDRPDRGYPKGEWRKPFPSSSAMPDNMVEHIMAVANEVDPELAARLMSICEKDPEAFNKIIRKQGRRLGSLVRLRESDPELYEVKVTELKTDAEIYHVAEAIRGEDQGEPSVQAKIVELEGLVRVRTAMSIRAQKLYIQRLERHLVGLQERLDDTSNRFDKIVQDRLGQLLQAVVVDAPNSEAAQID